MLCERTVKSLAEELTKLRYLIEGRKQKELEKHICYSYETCVVTFLCFYDTSKIMDWECSSVAECLPSMHNPGFNATIEKRKKKKKRKPKNLENNPDSGKVNYNLLIIKLVFIELSIYNVLVHST